VFAVKVVDVTMRSDDDDEEKEEKVSCECQAIPSPEAVQLLDRRRQVETVWNGLLLNCSKFDQSSSVVPGQVRTRRRTRADEKGRPDDCNNNAEQFSVRTQHVQALVRTVSKSIESVKLLFTVQNDLFLVTFDYIRGTSLKVK
jgi:hypothetical protein